MCILTVHRAFHLILALYFTLANMLINCISHFGWERASVCVCANDAMCCSKVFFVRVICKTFGRLNAFGVATGEQKKKD